MYKKIVINTSPLISLIAGLGDLSILQDLFMEVIVPKEVSDELLAKGSDLYDAKIFINDKWLNKKKKNIKIYSFLKNSLDTGEASVIQTALDNEIDLVCIDEVVGRRVARLNNLKVTGSLGIIISAKKKGKEIDIEKVLFNMKNHGIWISEDLENEVINICKNF